MIVLMTPKTVLMSLGDRLPGIKTSANVTGGRLVLLNGTIVDYFQITLSELSPPDCPLLGAYLSGSLRN